MYRCIECQLGDEPELAKRLAARTPRRSQMRGLGQPSPAAGGALPAAARLGTHQWQTHHPDDFFALDSENSASSPHRLGRRGRREHLGQCAGWAARTSSS